MKLLKAIGLSCTLILAFFVFSCGEASKEESIEPSMEWFALAKQKADASKFLCRLFGQKDDCNFCVFLKKSYPYWYKVAIDYKICKKEQSNSSICDFKDPHGYLVLGASWGECAGYCQRELKVNRTMIELQEIDPLGWSPPRYVNKISITPSEWQAIVNTIDIAKFSSLPKIIGCPDCADGKPIT